FELVDRPSRTVGDLPRLAAEVGEAALDDLEQDLVLVREIVVDGRTGEAQGGGHVVERGRCKSLAHEQGCGDAEDRLAPDLTPAGAAGDASCIARRRGCAGPAPVSVRGRRCGVGLATAGGAV